MDSFSDSLVEVETLKPTDSVMALVTEVLTLVASGFDVEVEGVRLLSVPGSDLCVLVATLSDGQTLRALVEPEPEWLNSVEAVRLVEGMVKDCLRAAVAMASNIASPLSPLVGSRCR